MQKISELDNVSRTDTTEVDTFTQGSTLSKIDKYMADEEAFGYVLYNIILREYGKEILDWEVETITITLRDRFPDIHDHSLDKIMSLIALANSMDGRLNFFNEANCFRHTINALNNLEPDYHFLGALLPHHVDWGMYEMGLLYPEYKLGEDSAKFLGLSFHHTGYLVLPLRLAEYQQFLDYFNKNTELVPRILERWGNESKKKDNQSIEALEEDDVIDMQCIMLHSIQAYWRMKQSALHRDIEHFALK